MDGYLLLSIIILWITAIIGFAGYNTSKLRRKWEGKDVEVHPDYIDEEDLPINTGKVEYILKDNGPLRARVRLTDNFSYYIPIRYIKLLPVIQEGQPKRKGVKKRMPNIVRVLLWFCLVWVVIDLVSNEHNIILFFIHGIK